MNIFRRGLLAWALALPIWAVLLVMSFSSWSFIQLVWAQDQLPTKPPVVAVPTKVPVDPQPTKSPVEAPPTKEPILPTEVPTKAPTKIPSPAVSGTAWPTLPPTKTAIPTDLPTKPALPTDLPTTPPQPATTATGSHSPSTGQAQNEPPSGSSAQPGHPSIVAAVSMTGVVFDDANDNGQRDPGEAGLPGVAVTAATDEGRVIVVTGADGTYAAPAGATVQAVPPIGWQTGKSSKTNGEIPLRSRPAMPAPAPREVTPLTIAQTTLDFAPLIALGLGLGAVMAIGFLRLSRAVTTSNQALALLLVRMQRTSEKPLTFESGESNRATDVRVLRLLNQAGLDAVGRSLNIERVLTLNAGDRPAITALGADRRGRAAFVVLTPLEAKAFQRAWRVAPTSSGAVAFERAESYPLERLSESLASGHPATYPLDALNSGLFVADDLAAAFAYLAAELPVSARTLPRTARWTLLVVPLPKNDLTLRNRWRLGRR